MIVFQYLIHYRRIQGTWQDVMRLQKFRISMGNLLMTIICGDLELKSCRSFPLTLLLRATKSQALVWLHIGMKWIDV